MRPFDLRDAHGSLEPLAPFKVLAVMTHPDDRAARERMVGLIRRETGVGRSRRSPLVSKQFLREVGYSAGRGGSAGGLLLTLLQLHANGERATLSRAIPLTASLLPDWEELRGPDWSPDDHIGHIPRSRRKLLAAFQKYRAVSHLWAALIHGQQNDRSDIWPGSVETLPVFLGYAAAIAEMGCALPWPGRDRRRTLSPAELWRFFIPEDLVRTVRLVASPVTRETGTR